MHSLTISFGPTGTMWQLLFNTKEAAELVWNNLTAAKASDTIFDASDDFGQTLMLDLADTHGAMLEDMDKTSLAHIERALHQTRMQNKAQQLAESDASLRRHMGRQGPAILTPGIGNGAFGR